MSVAVAQQQLQRAVAQHQSGDLAGAASIYTNVLRENPRVADAWHLSGLIAYQQGAMSEAERLILKALELTPDQPDYLSNLAAVLLATDRAEEAEAAARLALKCGGTRNKCRRHLATALSRQRRFAESIAILQQIIAEQPLDATAHCNLGAILLEANRHDEALSVLDTAVQLDPNSHQARLNFGGALRECRQLDRALAELNTAVQLGPNVPQCYVNRGNTHLFLGNTAEALQDFQQAIQLDPESAIALNGLGQTLQKMSQWTMALDALDLACQLDGPLSQFESNRLYCASLMPDMTRHQLFELHADWGCRTEARTAVLPAVRYSHDRIRIGYVSPDFRNHATMRFFLPQLEAHDRNLVEVYCYSGGRPDAVSDRVQSSCDGWRSTATLSDPELISQIRHDEIDILIDLAGHTAGNRLPVFASRPATVQVSYLGYPNTTGLTRVDCFLTDAIREDEQTEQFFTESLVYLPYGACCFEAPSALPIEDPPCLETGHVTFGSTHRLEKVSQDSLQLWGKVLDSVPDAKLLFIRDSLVNENTQSLLRGQLQEAGIDDSRTELSWQLPQDHLEIYADIDILLDVFPWGSGTTAYECMWMGVPIPTLRGDRGSCRATASLMHNLGLDELSAETSDDYVQLTAQLASNPRRLQKLRRSIRPKMEQSVCNARRFTAELERTFLTLLRSASSRSPADGSINPDPESHR